MYLSRIELDVNRRSTMRALDNPQMIHCSIEQSTRHGTHRNLWRIDWLHGKCYLLIVSQQQPDLDIICNQFGIGDNPGITKSYDRFIAKLENGQKWQFRLRANPVRNVATQSPDTNRGKVIAHVTHQQQKRWLSSRAEIFGFSLDENGYDIVHDQWLRFTKNKSRKHMIAIRAVTFEGQLTISNVERFCQTLTFGAGRGKAYGCGLLTLAHIGG